MGDGAMDSFGCGLEEIGDDGGDARGVEDVDNRLRVGGCDPNRGVLPRRCRSADQEREIQTAPFHLTRHIDHLVERGSDQPRQADDVRTLGGRSIEDLLRRHHHTETTPTMFLPMSWTSPFTVASTALPRARGRPPAACSASMYGSR